MAFSGHCHIIAAGSCITHTRARDNTDLVPSEGTKFGCITHTRARGNLPEIDENLMRNELHYIDRGQAFKRRDEILKAYGKRATVGRPVNSADSAPLKTTSDIADEMGVSKRALYVEKQIARDILPEVQEAIKAADLLLQAGNPSSMYENVCSMYET